MQAALRESQEEAVQKSLAMFNAGAVGAGFARKKYEELLQKFFRKEFEVTVFRKLHYKMLKTWFEKWYGPQSVSLSHACLLFLHAGVFPNWLYT